MGGARIRCGRVELGWEDGTGGAEFGEKRMELLEKVPSEWRPSGAHLG